MNNTNGIIAEQSKKKIAEAMLKVMNIYDYKEITVTQITQEARISRKTFYRHFRDKDEVLKHLFDSLYQECLSSITESGIHHYWDVVQCFFDFWEKHAKTLILMKRSNLLPQLFEESYDRSFEIRQIIRIIQIRKNRRYRGSLWRSAPISSCLQYWRYELNAYQMDRGWNEYSFIKTYFMSS